MAALFSREDRKENVTAIRLRINRMRENKIVTIQKTGEGADVRLEELFTDRAPELSRISAQEWDDFVGALYDTFHVRRWRERYIDRHALDGTDWELVIELSGGRKRVHHGSNAFPRCWPALMERFRRYAAI